MDACGGQDAGHLPEIASSFNVRMALRPLSVRNAGLTDKSQLATGSC